VELTLHHSRELEAQRNEVAKLKDELIQSGLQYARALKEAIAASDAKVEEPWKEFADAEKQLRAELVEETKQLEAAQHRNTELVADQADFDQMIIDTDAQALSKYLLSRYASLHFLAVYLYTVLFFSSSRVLSGISSTRACQGRQDAG
jgi:DNA repair exonuclease SbcCD ATPase subunit